jgi:hypothetical protein
LVDLVGASVVYRQRPKTITEVGHLKNDGFLLKRKITESIDHVLVRVGNEFLGRN